MTRYLAFLRAINVGGHTVKMDRLRALFQELGYASVETFIASGNVIFDSPGEAAELEKQIEAHLHQGLGYEVATFLRTPAQLQQVMATEPVSAAELNSEGSTLYVGFLRGEPSKAAQEKLLGFANDVDSFAVIGEEVYWLARRGMGESTFSGARLEKALGMQATLRNVTTVRKLAAKYSQA